MNKKFDVRVLSVLLVAALAIVGYFAYQSTGREARDGHIQSPLKDIKLSATIKGNTPPLFILTERNGGLEFRTAGKDSPLSTQAMLDLNENLSNAIAAQLRENKIPFVPTTPLSEDGYMAEPSEEEKKAASLSFQTEIHKIRDVYVYSVTMKLEKDWYQPRYSTSHAIVTIWSSLPRENYTTSEAKVIPGLSEAARAAAETFANDYKAANGMSVPIQSGPMAAGR
jgi:hypothetical protein